MGAIVGKSFDLVWSRSERPELEGRSIRLGGVGGRLAVVRFV